MLQHVTSDQQKSTKSEGWKGCEIGKLVRKFGPQRVKRKLKNDPLCELSTWLASPEQIYNSSRTTTTLPADVFSLLSFFFLPHSHTFLMLPVSVSFEPSSLANVGLRANIAF